MSKSRNQIVGMAVEGFHPRGFILDVGKTKGFILDIANTKAFILGTEKMKAFM